MQSQTLASVLGVLGLIPFVAGSGAMFIDDPAISGPALYALTVYAAVILSFLGAVHWGTAMHSATPVANFQLTMSVLPALIAWSALSLQNPRDALITLGISFVIMLIADVVAVAKSVLPTWYRTLRIPLTIIVCACLALAVWRLS